MICTTVTSGRAPRRRHAACLAAIDGAVLLQFLQQGFQRNAVGASEMEGAGDLALADRRRARSRMKASTCSLVGKGAALPPFLPSAALLLPRCARILARPREAASVLRLAVGVTGGFELDFDKGILVVVGVDDIVLDANRAVIGVPGLHFGDPLFLAVVDLQACRSSSAPRRNHSRGDARSSRRPAKSAIR